MIEATPSVQRRHSLGKVKPFAQKAAKPRAYTATAAAIFP